MTLRSVWKNLGHIGNECTLLRGKEMLNEWWLTVWKIHRHARANTLVYKMSAGTICYCAQC